MNLHAALVHHVKCCCIEDGVEEVDPKQDPGYLVYYRQYAGNRGFTRKHDVQGQFSKEDHLTIARAAYAIGDSYKMLLISLAIAVVSRGDEIRDLLLKHMRLKKSDAIGGSTGQCNADKWHGDTATYAVCDALSWCASYETLCSILFDLA